MADEEKVVMDRGELPAEQIASEDEAEEMQPVAATADGNGAPGAANEPFEVDAKLTAVIPLSFLLQRVNDSRREKILMRELVMYIPFVLLFVYFTVWRRNTTQEFYEADAIRQALCKTELPPTLYDPNAVKNADYNYYYDFFNVHNPKDWHQWFAGLVVPTYYDYMRRGAVPSRDGPVGTNYQVGPVRVRQKRVRSDSCDINDNLYSSAFTQRACYGRYSTANKDTSVLPGGYGYSHSCKYVGLSFVGWYDTYTCGGYVVDFPANFTFNESLALANKLYADKFISPAATRFVLVESYTYNPALDSFLSIRLAYEITDGGGWIPTVRIFPFRLYSPDTYTTTQIGLDAWLVVYVAFYWLRWFVGWMRDYRRSGSHVLHYLFDVWALLELFLLLTLTCAFAALWDWWRTSKVVRDSMTLPDPSLAYSEELAYAVSVWQLHSYFLAVASVLVFIKVIKFFSMNDHLNVLTRTLSRTAGHIIGVVVIFCLIVTAFAVSGNILYGPGVAAYRNISFSFSTLFLSMMGKFDYQSLRDHSRSLTFIYFWSFIVLSLFIMLNFITAIIGNGFDEVTATSKPLPIEVQVARIIRRLSGENLRRNFESIIHKLVLRSRRLRHELVHDYLLEHRRSLLRAANISEEQIASGERDDPQFTIDRNRLGDLIPANDRAYISERYLDDLFIEAVEDYDLIAKKDEDEDEAKQRRALQDGVQQAFTRCFEDIARELNLKTSHVLRGELTRTLAQTKSAIVFDRQASRRGSMMQLRGSDSLENSSSLGGSRLQDARDRLRTALDELTSDNGDRLADPSFVEHLRTTLTEASALPIDSTSGYGIAPAASRVAGLAQSIDLLVNVMERVRERKK